MIGEERSRMCESYQGPENSSQDINGGYSKGLEESCMPKDLPIGRRCCDGKTSAEEESKAGAYGGVCLLGEFNVFNNGYLVQ